MNHKHPKTSAFTPAKQVGNEEIVRNYFEESCWGAGDESEDWYFPWELGMNIKTALLRGGVFHFANLADLGLDDFLLDYLDEMTSHDAETAIEQLYQLWPRIPPLPGTVNPLELAACYLRSHPETILVAEVPRSICRLQGTYSQARQWAAICLICQMIRNDGMFGYTLEQCAEIMGFSKNQAKCIREMLLGGGVFRLIENGSRKNGGRYSTFEYTGEYDHEFHL